MILILTTTAWVEQSRCADSNCVSQYRSPCTASTFSVTNYITSSTKLLWSFGCLFTLWNDFLILYTILLLILELWRKELFNEKSLIKFVILLLPSIELLRKEWQGSQDSNPNSWLGPQRMVLKTSTVPNGEAPPLNYQSKGLTAEITFIKNNIDSLMRERKQP